MRIGVPKETLEGELRVALIPESVKALKAKGLDVVVESGAGVGSGAPDEQYTEAGAEIGDPWGADIVLHVAVPTTEEIAKVGSGKVLSGLARRINRELETANIGSPEDVDAALAAL